MLVDGIYKVLVNIKKDDEGQFRGLDCIANECFYVFAQKKWRFWAISRDRRADDLAHNQQSDDDLHENDILKLLDNLPIGYRTVFNLYALEGYNHREIAHLLQVSVNTSKSQLRKARAMLKQWLEKWAMPLA